MVQGLCNKEPGMLYVHSTSPLVAVCSSWENFMFVQNSSISESLTLNMGVSPQDFHNNRKLSLQFKDQDSSSTQCTGQSCPEVASIGESHPDRQSIVSAKSDHTSTKGKPVDGQTKHASFVGNHDQIVQVDYSPSIACIPPHHAECYYGSVMAAYGSQAMFPHPQMLEMAPVRVPLPLNITANEPIYVNAKQYHAILRRRKYRAKLEAQNKLMKDRKPYLHESRHLHALKRARGSGGRFLNMKKLQESKPTSAGPKLDVSGSSRLQPIGILSESEVQQPKNNRDGEPTNSCSDITSASNRDDIFQQPEFWFSGHTPHIARAMHGHSGSMHGAGGAHRHFSVL